MPFSLFLSMQHHGHYHTEAVRPHGPKIRSGMQLLNSTRLCHFPVSRLWDLRGDY